MQTEHVLLLLLHIKSSPTVNHWEAFIVKQQHEMQIIYRQSFVSAFGQ